MKRQIFETAAIGRAPRRNVFDLCHTNKFTMKQGYLVPIVCEDVLPGETWKLDAEIVIRLAPLASPAMTNLKATIHGFFVPNRIIWDEFEDFMSPPGDGTDVAPVMPHLKSGDINDGWSNESELWDYMGLPTFHNPVPADPTKDITIQTLPFRAYHQIWNDWYRDQNLQPLAPVPTASGDDAAWFDSDGHILRKRAWAKDYRTSALPWPQRGDDVLIPVEGSGTFTYLPQSKVLRTDNNAAPVGGDLGVTGAVPNLFADLGGANEEAVRIENIDQITIANITATINDLRLAEATQKWMELSARGGSRYNEQNKVIFGVNSPDARLQRAEYIGGGMFNVKINEVLSTFEDATSTPQGNMTGHGLGFGRSNRMKYFSQEHGWIIVLLNVQPEPEYYQHVPRKFSRLDKFDYFWPQFANLGEQEVLYKEVHWDGTTTTVQANGTFGYQSRYAEYKFSDNVIHGLFKTTLQYWTQVRDFAPGDGNVVELNDQFIEAQPSNRIFAVTDEVDNLYVHCNTYVYAWRPIPYNSVPSLV